jgi:carbonic anhydrase
MCDWGYCSHNGPDKWGELYPIANGSRQSPIDINSGECHRDNSLPSLPLKIEYDVRGKIITNTGAGWRVDFDNGHSLLEGGPLSYRYKLEQFHCHWGKDETEGSEHTVNGNCYPMELHLVHWNCDKYESFMDAVDKEDGLAVLGIFYEVSRMRDDWMSIIFCVCVVVTSIFYIF